MFDISPMSVFLKAYFELDVSSLKPSETELSEYFKSFFFCPFLL